jgi:hypothetical protein
MVSQLDLTLVDVLVGVTAKSLEIRSVLEMGKGLESDWARALEQLQGTRLDRLMGIVPLAVAWLLSLALPLRQASVETRVL